MKNFLMSLFLLCEFFAASDVLAKRYALDFEQLSLSELEARERALAELQASAEAQLYSYSSLLAQYQQTQQDKLSAQDFTAYLERFYAFHAHWQQRYDEAYLLRHAFLIETAWLDFQRFCNSASPFHSAEAERLQQEIRQHYESWLAVRNQLGSSNREELEQHRKRHVGVYYFFLKLAAFYELFQAEKPDYFSSYKEPSYAPYQRQPSTFLTAALAAPRRMLTGLSVAAGGAALFLPAAADLLFPTKSGSFYVSFSQKMDTIIRLKSSLQPLKLAYINRTLLPNFRDAAAKDVFLLLPSHHLGGPDAALLAGVGLPRYLIFSKPAEAVPGFLAQLLANHPQFISVGTRPSNGASAREQVEAALESEQSNIIVNFAQGHLDPSQIMAINSSFSRELVKRLDDQGYNLRVVPLKWHAPSPFPLATYELPTDFPIDTVAAEFMPELPTGLLKQMLAKEFAQEAALPDFFGLWLRSVWLQHHSLFPDLSTAEMLKRVNLMKAV